VKKKKQKTTQAIIAKKAAKLKAGVGKPALSSKLAAANQAHIIEAGLVADVAQHQHNQKHAHGARAPPMRLLGKPEVCAIAGVTFPTIWAWMRQGRFPRARVIGGANSKSVWLSTEIDTWMVALPRRPLKGDARPPKKMHAEYDDSGHCIGFSYLRGPQGMEAFDADCRPLGLYPDHKSAAHAIARAVGGHDD
jgi:predicted DNA-binding transcriptional regulator AlpA